MSDEPAQQDAMAVDQEEKRQAAQQDVKKSSDEIMVSAETDAQEKPTNEGASSAAAVASSAKAPSGDSKARASSQPAAATNSKGGISWDIATGAKPASQRPKAEPRPPKWIGSSASSASSYGRAGKVKQVLEKIPRQLGLGEAAGVTRSFDLSEFKAKQQRTLEVMRAYASKKEWSKLHHMHFDWWMFPIDDGSRDNFNVHNEAEVNALRGDAAWLEGYHEGVELVARAWGWDVAAEKRIDPADKDMEYTDWDVRLAKMCRSLYLFHEEKLLRSLQAFAFDIQKHEKRGGSFFYGRICLDELLYFQLPR